MLGNKKEKALLKARELFSLPQARLVEKLQALQETARHVASSGDENSLQELQELLYALAAEAAHHHLSPAAMEGLVDLITWHSATEMPPRVLAECVAAATETEGPFSSRYEDLWLRYMHSHVDLERWFGALVLTRKRVMKDDHVNHLKAVLLDPSPIVSMVPAAEEFLVRYALNSQGKSEALRHLVERLEPEELEKISVSSSEWSITQALRARKNLDRASVTLDDRKKSIVAELSVRLKHLALKKFLVLCASIIFPPWALVYAALWSGLSIERLILIIYLASGALCGVWWFVRYLAARISDTRTPLPQDCSYEELMQYAELHEDAMEAILALMYKRTEWLGKLLEWGLCRRCKLCLESVELYLRTTTKGMENTAETLKTAVSEGRIEAERIIDFLSTLTDDSTARRNLLILLEALWPAIRNCRAIRKLYVPGMSGFPPLSDILANRIAEDPCGNFVSLLGSAAEDPRMYEAYRPLIIRGLAFLFSRRTFFPELTRLFLQVYPLDMFEMLSLSCGRGKGLSHHERRRILRALRYDPAASVPMLAPVTMDACSMEELVSDIVKHKVLENDESTEDVFLELLEREFPPRALLSALEYARRTLLNRTDRLSISETLIRLALLGEGSPEEKRRELDSLLRLQRLEEAPPVVRRLSSMLERHAAHAVGKHVAGPLEPASRGGRGGDREGRAERILAEAVRILEEELPTAQGEAELARLGLERCAETSRRNRARAMRAQRRLPPFIRRALAVVLGLEERKERDRRHSCALRIMRLDRGGEEPGDSWSAEGHTSIAERIFAVWCRIWRKKENEPHLRAPHLLGESRGRRARRVKRLLENPLGGGGRRTADASFEIHEAFSREGFDAYTHPAVAAGVPAPRESGSAMGGVLERILRMADASPFLDGEQEETVELLLRLGNGSADAGRTTTEALNERFRRMEELLPSALFAEALAMTPPERFRAVIESWLENLPPIYAEEILVYSGAVWHPACTSDPGLMWFVVDNTPRAAMPHLAAFLVLHPWCPPRVAAHCLMSCGISRNHPMLSPILEHFAEREPAELERMVDELLRGGARTDEEKLIEFASLSARISGTHRDVLRGNPRLWNPRFAPALADAACLFEDVRKRLVSILGKKRSGTTLETMGAIRAAIRLLANHERGWSALGREECRSIEEMVADNLDSASKIQLAMKELATIQSMAPGTALSIQELIMDRFPAAGAACAETTVLVEKSIAMNEKLVPIEEYLARPPSDAIPPASPLGSAARTLAAALAAGAIRGSWSGEIRALVSSIHAEAERLSGGDTESLRRAAVPLRKIDGVLGWYEAYPCAEPPSCGHFPCMEACRRWSHPLVVESYGDRPLEILRDLETALRSSENGGSGLDEVLDAPAAGQAWKEATEMALRRAVSRVEIARNAADGAVEAVNSSGIPIVLHWSGGSLLLRPGGTVRLAAASTQRREMRLEISLPMHGSPRMEIGGGSLFLRSTEGRPQGRQRRHREGNAEGIPRLRLLK